MFQTLPYLVIDNIVKHFLVRHRATYGEIYYFELEGLLHSCQSWRLAVILRLCKKGAFANSYVPNASDQPVLHIPNWPYSYGVPPPNTKQLIKSLQLPINLTDIATGKSLDYLKYDEDGKPFVLENVRKLYCKLCLSYMKDLDKLNIKGANAKLDKLVQLLISLTPNIQEVHLVNNCYDVEDKSGKALILVSSLVTKLSQIAKSKLSLSARHSLKVPSIKHVYIPTSVTHLEFLDEGLRNYAPLVTNCSSTLQTLSITIKYFNDYLGLFFGKTTCKHVVYPCMRLLNIQFSKFGIYNPKEYTHEGSAPFPILQKLVAKGGNALIWDNELLRANSDTLQHLDIEVGPYWIKALTAKCVFYPGSHKNLTTAKISIWDGLHSRLPTQTEIRLDEYAQVCGNIACNASVFECHNVLYHSTIKASQLAPRFYGFPLLQKLDLGDLQLTFKEAFELVKTLPMLSHLSGSFKASFIKPKNKTRDKYLGYMVRKHFPLNNSLTHLNLKLHDGNVAINDIRYIILLVILCPSVYRLESISHYGFHYRHYKDKIMEEKGYEEYESRISSLKF